jgi:glucose-1-phosphate cytidylyltransferase
MKVIILAGGLGTRIAEESDFIPKPMILIGNKPILWHIIKYFSSFGFKDFIICSGYKGQMIKDFIEKEKISDCKIQVIFTGEKSNTGKRLKKIKYLIKGKFFLTYGDGLSNVNLKKVVKLHNSNNAVATLTAAKPPARFGRIILKANKVINFFEKKDNTDEWVNGGFMVCEEKIFDYLKGKKDPIFEKDVLEKLSKKKLLLAYKHKSFWHPMDTIKDKRTLNTLWKKKLAPWKNW